MLQPKKTKFRKQFKGRMHGNSKGGNLLNFGAYGLKALTPARITSSQIESARSKILDITRVNTSFLIDKNVLSNCVPCSVRVDNEFRGLIEIISQEKHFEHMLESLFLNINSNNDIEISQFCIVRLLIDNDLFINANYYIDKFSDNKLIKEYIVSLNLD